MRKRTHRRHRAADPDAFMRVFEIVREATH